MGRHLVADDDLHVCPAINAWLNRCGFAVAVVADGTAGLIAFDDSIFDLMTLLDVIDKRLGTDKGSTARKAGTGMRIKHRWPPIQARGEQSRA